MFSKVISAEITNKIIGALLNGQKQKGFDKESLVSKIQFYGFDYSTEDIILE